MKTGYLSQHEKLISYLKIFEVSKSESRFELGRLDKKDLRSALENINSVPDWDQEKERRGLMWAKDTYGPDILLSFVITYKDPMKKMDPLERMEYAFPHANKDLLSGVERMSKAPFTGRLKLKDTSQIGA